MDSDDIADNYCYAWEGDNFDIPPFEPKDRDQFCMQFRIEFTYLMNDDQEDEAEADYLADNLQTITLYHQLWEPFQRSSRENLKRDDISAMLSRLGILTQDQPFMIQEISARADEIASRAENRAQKVLPMNVVIGLIVEGTPEGNVTAMRESMEAELRCKPARREAVEGLDKVKVGGGGEKLWSSHCMICLKKLEDGCEATRMPCLHVYHGNCIENWLLVSHVCPLCRFELPH